MTLLFIFPDHSYTVSLREIPMESIEKKNALVRMGGWWSPSHCTSQWRVAIVIPYRDREPHLRVFLNNLHPFLQKQRVFYHIIVIEQVRRINYKDKFDIVL